MRLVLSGAIHRAWGPAGNQVFLACISSEVETTHPTMLLLLAPLVAVYQFVLEPVAPFTWFGLSFSLLDVAAALRTCVALSQLREGFHARHVAKKQASKDVAIQEVEDRSFVRDATAALMVVFGGELMTGEYQMPLCAESEWMLTSSCWKLLRWADPLHS